MPKELKGNMARFIETARMALALENAPPDHWGRKRRPPRVNRRPAIRYLTEDPKDLSSEVLDRLVDGEKPHIIQVRKVKVRQGFLDQDWGRETGPVGFYVRVEQFGKVFYSTLDSVGLLDGLEETGLGPYEILHVSYLRATRHGEQAGAIRSMMQRYAEAKAGNVSLPMAPFLLVRPRRPRD
jgi:hypothetical protein